MAFQPQPTITPTGIGALVVILKTDPDADDPQSAHFQIEIERSDGSRKSLRGDLVPHITPAQRDGLLSFMASLRAQAEEEIL